MTETEYSAVLTENVLALTGPDFVFPESAEDDMRYYFRQRTDPAEAAEELVAEWAEA